MNKLLVVDYRLNETIKEYFLKLGYILIPTLKNDLVYKEISGHPDIFLTKIGDKYIVEPTLYNYLIKHIKGAKVKKNIIQGKTKIKASYPDNICYNVCSFGKYVFHNFKYTDPEILKIIENINDNRNKNIEKHDIIMINIKQGYSKCSITPIVDMSAVTSDIVIKTEMDKLGIDSILLKNVDKYVKLLDTKFEGDSTRGYEEAYSKLHGFIGGASAYIDGKFILFGSIDKMEAEDRIVLLNFLRKYNIEIIDFDGLEIVDYGSVIEINI